jgi:hypothetical protein
MRYNIIKLLGVIVCIFIIIYILYNISIKSINRFREKYLSQIENFKGKYNEYSNSKKVILIGDFIFGGDDSASGNKSLTEIFNKYKGKEIPDIHKSKGIPDIYKSKEIPNISIIRDFTKKCFVSDDLKDYLNKIGNINSINNKNTYFFLSMGTNDIIKNYDKCSKDKTICKTSSEISDIWNNNIKALIDKFPNSIITVVLNDDINTNESYNHCDSFIKNSQALTNEAKNNNESRMAQANSFLKIAKKIQKGAEGFKSLNQEQKNHPISLDFDKFNNTVSKYINDHNKKNKQNRINIIYLSKIKIPKYILNGNGHIAIPFVKKLYSEMINQIK